MTRILQNESRAEWSSRGNSRSDRMLRANSQFMEAIATSPAQNPSPTAPGITATDAGPVAARARSNGVPGGREGAADLLSGGFAVAKAMDSARAVEASSEISGVLFREFSFSSSAVAGPEKPALIHTPFGTYDADSIDRRIGFEIFGSCPMEVYFVTHAPGEWMRDAQSRIEFEKIYGAEVLHIVDCHGTVPKNIDPVWVTKPAVESASGRA